MRRLSILLATVGTLLIAPTAHAEVGVEPLRVIITGSGAGQVYSSPESAYRGSPEINCFYESPGPPTGVCQTFMSREGGGFEQISLTAKPAPGSIFLGWKVINTEFEGCVGTFTTCAPFVEPPGTGSGEAEVIATFDLEPPKFALTIAKTGEGTITSSPAGIECTGAKTGAECEHKFELNELVTLTASPAGDYAFFAWAGCAEHVGLTCKVTMDKARMIKALFIATSLLTVEKAGSGYGKVVATGISCDENCSKATSAIKTGTSVTVKTVSTKGSEKAVFEGGTGSASGCSGATCTFTISANSSVKVKFDPIPTKTLTVNLIGPAAYKGKVSGKGKDSYGPAISCRSGCATQTETFFSTDEVTLSALAPIGYTFSGWNVIGGESGDCDDAKSSCHLRTDADKTVSAEFK